MFSCSAPDLTEWGHLDLACGGAGRKLREDQRGRGRSLPGSKLVASGYDRFIIDTQTYTATAIAVPRQNAYGFELQHRGTLADGPTKAKKMFRTLNQRAARVGSKVRVQ
ncbi:hypothetical protein [Prosthecobacter fusiformis]|uniref:hypothetical protein n=1 Tax=Prosthecobacter fusiformis TaxID=48464 RepID=UPI00105F31DA|nr:hypothetical protein [Prosthecobacter fusiformis]